MPKCDITIQFDRTDRTYHGGETVSGRVLIRVNERTNSNGIRLTRFWKTHGYGNTDTGEQHQTTLDEPRELPAGQLLEFPFSFEVDRQPMTYRGKHLNVDHYVKVDVDVPWAFDPKAEEEFIVVPGKRPDEVTGNRDEIVNFTRKPVGLKGPWKILIYLLLAVVLAMFAYLAIFLLPFILIIVAFFWVRKTLVYARLGEVKLTTPHQLIASGEDWPLELRFTPRSNFRINGISVQITGIESATSGSGTNKTTRTHNIYKRMHTLKPEGELRAGEKFDRWFALRFPETSAYSFQASSNSITWTAEVRIDIPMYPDWSSKKTVQVLPQQFFDETFTFPDGKGHEVEVIPAHDPESTLGGPPKTPWWVPADTGTAIGCLVFVAAPTLMLCWFVVQWLLSN